MSYTKILQECIKIAEERQAQYGEASDSLERCSDILSNAFKINLGVPEICQVLVALKLSREGHLTKKDNLIDCINYLAIAVNYSINTKKDEDNKK